MLTDREGYRTKAAPAQKMRQYAGHSLRAPCGGRQKIKCDIGQARRGFAKSIRRAAAEFIGAKKKWSIFVSFSDVSSNLEREFNALSKQWKDETFFQSSLSEICFHPAYQTIMAMGKEALPFILKDLTQRLDHWFYALKCIARKDIAAGSVNLEEARQRWLDWGRKEKYLL
jgi:hypothetical protein